MLLKRVKIDKFFRGFCVILCTFSMIIIWVHFNFMKRKYYVVQNSILSLYCWYLALIVVIVLLVSTVSENSEYKIVAKF